MAPRKEPRVPTRTAADLDHGMTEAALGSYRAIREPGRVVLVGEDGPSGGTAWAGGTVPRGNRVRCSTGAPLEGRKEGSFWEVSGGSEYPM